MTFTASAIVEVKRLIQDLLDQFPSSPLNAGDMEPGLSGVLELIQGNLLERERFVQIFIEMLQGEQRAPEWLIAYCMRTLRWPEIEQAAEAVIAAGDPWKLSQAWEVLEAYEDEDDDDWFGVYLFERYAISSTSPD